MANCSSSGHINKFIMYFVGLLRINKHLKNMKIYRSEVTSGIKRPKKIIPQFYVEKDCKFSHILVIASVSCECRSYLKKWIHETVTNKKTPIPFRCYAYETCLVSYTYLLHKWISSVRLPLSATLKNKTFFN